MAVSAGDAFLDVHSRLASNFGRQLSSQVQGPITRAGEDASHHFGRSFARGLKTASIAIGAGLAAATVLATRGVLATTKAASDLNETVNKTDVIFGKSAKGIQQWARGSAKSFGLSRNEALTNASAFGDMFRQLGIGLPTTTKMSKSMVGLASDLASFSNADISQVLEAQQAAFRGEYDSLQRFIPAINAARVEQVALGQTHKKSAKDLTAAEKAQATYTIMLHDSTRAQGDFARTSGGLANQQRIQKAQWEDLKTTIGQGFLPAQLAVTKALTSKVLPALKVLATNYGPKVGAVVTRIATSFARSVPSAKELGFGLDALSAAFHGEGITTSADSFVGKMERLGVTGRKVVDWAKNFGPQLAGIGRSFTQLFQSSSQVGPALTQAGGGGHAFANSLIIVGPVLDVVARNVHNLIPWLPAILAGFLALRAIRSVTQPLMQLGDLISNLTAPFRIAALFAQKRALQAHTTALMENTAAMRGNAVSTELSTAAGNAGIIASIRGRAAMIGQAIAAKAVAVASKAWAAVQWLVNAALTANPIGIVVVAIAALAAGIIYAYKHSETFRRIVDTAFKAIKGAVGTAVNFIIGLFRAWFNTSTTVVLGILHMFGKLPGPMGAPFRAAERAVQAAKKTVNDQLDKIQARVNKLTGKDIPVTASLKLNFSPTYTQKDWVADRQRAGRMAGGGGPLQGPGTGTSDSIPLWGSKGEFMVNALSTRKWLPVLRFINADRKAAGGPVGQIDSQGRVVNKIEARGTGARLHAGIAAFIAKFGGGGSMRAFLQLADRLPYIWGGVGPGGYDCSGLTGEVFARHTRRPSYHRYFTTASNFRALGFKPGPGGVYTIGVNAAGGHMAGRYAGLAFEAANTRAGIRVGGAARSVGSFPAQYHMASGGLVEAMRTVDWLAQQGAIIGGDPAKLRLLNMDRGGFLPPGLSMAYNGTGHPEPVGFDYREMAKAFADELRANPPRVAVDEIMTVQARLDRQVGGVTRR